MITIFLAILCSTTGCHADTIQVSTPAAIVAMCESGDTVTVGSLDWQAVNVNADGTVDSGAWQFNNYWIWNADDRWIVRPFANQVLGMSSDTALHIWPTVRDMPPRVQYALFEYVWNNGRGWSHWSASRGCWGRYMSIVDGVAVVKELGQ